MLEKSRSERNDNEKVLAWFLSTAFDECRTIHSTNAAEKNEDGVFQSSLAVFFVHVVRFELNSIPAIVKSHVDDERKKLRTDS